MSHSVRAAGLTRLALFHVTYVTMKLTVCYWLVAATHNVKASLPGQASIFYLLI